MGIVIKFVNCSYVQDRTGVLITPPKTTTTHGNQKEGN